MTERARRVRRQEGRIGTAAEGDHHPFEAVELIVEPGELEAQVVVELVGRFNHHRSMAAKSARSGPRFRAGRARLAGHGHPDRWNEQRFGLVVQNSVAAVPAWAPIGYDSRRYRRYLGEDGSDGLVEVLAHHRDRWGHVDRFDDFVDLLTFERFDAEEWPGSPSKPG